jgi:GT2 family glycosyltransferase
LCEAFFMYGEDMEWCSRFRSAGWKVGVCSKVVARHHQSASAARTWNVGEAERRMAQGTLAAIRLRRGHRYSQLYARIFLGSLWIEAHHPLRSRLSRRASRAAFDAWSSAVRAR